MLSQYWKSSAFLISYDGSGGWFDHVAPPQVDANGYGLRVPALLVSPYARAGSGERHRPGRHQRTEVHRGQLVAARADRPGRGRDQYRRRVRLRRRARGPRSCCRSPPVESEPLVGATGAVYLTYGSAAAVIALMLIMAAVLPWTAAG